MKTSEVPIELMRSGVQIGAEAAAICEKIAAEQTMLETKAPQVADVLIENGLVDPLDKEATVQLLQDPGAALDIVTRLGKQAAAPRSMGHTIKAADDGHDPQFPAQKDSDRVFEEKLNSANG